MLDVRDDLELANYQLDTVNIFSDSGFWVDKKKGGIRNWRKNISDIAEFGDFCLLQMNGFRQLHVVIWHIFYFLISIKRVYNVCMCSIQTILDISYKWAR